ncbi:MAG TPA: hypothetical protein VGE31_03310 [Candidatus Paceibacterota bacterium]
MATAPNTSFIPKRGPVKRARQTASRQVHLFTIFSYVLFTATLVATVAVFFYHRYIEGLRTQEIEALNIAVTSFNDVEMKRVLEFDSRLRQADSRLKHSVSVASIFDALEVATVQSVRLNNVSIERDSDSQFNIEAEVQAASFDSSLFQRGIFERNPIVESIGVNELEIVSRDDVVEGATPGVKFKANLVVPLTSVPYLAPNESVPVPVEIELSTSSASSSDAALISDSQPTL